MLAQVNANVQESVTGISVAKAFRQEQTIYDEFREVNSQSYRVNLRQGFVFSGIFPVLGTVAGMGTALIVYFGGLRVLSALVSPGDWFLFVESIALFWFPLTGIASFWSQFQLGLSASERVFALIDAEPRVRADATSSQWAAARRDRVPPTSTSATPSRRRCWRASTDDRGGRDGGAGRPHGRRQVEPGQAGRALLRIPGRAAAHRRPRHSHALTCTTIAANLGIVPPDALPLSRHGARQRPLRQPDASDPQCAAGHAASAAATGWTRCPRGSTRHVGEEGRGISMGQRQLVALARVLLQDPAIIILDEATASVDPLTEAQIQEGLDVVLRDRTAIVIAHRLSTIRAADRIMVLQRGRDHRGGRPRRVSGAGRPLRRTLQHLLPPPVAGLRSDDPVGRRSPPSV